MKSVSPRTHQEKAPPTSYGVRRCTACMACGCMWGNYSPSSFEEDDDEEEVKIMNSFGRGQGQELFSHATA